MKKQNFLIILIVLFSLIGMDALAYYNPSQKKDNSKEIKSVGAGCLPATAFKILEFNNVRARVNNGGDMWWDFGSAIYQVPKTQDASALFAGSIWVGGVDTNGQLRLAAHKFREDGSDFFPGPLVAGEESPNVGNVTAEICTRYDRMYYVTKNMVSEFIAYSNSEFPELDFADYTIPEVISSWPAHGPTEDLYDRFLAPFKDVDGDGVYNPGAGDYPYYIFDSKNYDCNSIPEREADSLNNEDMTLFGDATVWWVYNDRGNIHGETGGEAIGMEFRAQAFAFSTNDELNNMTFYNYQIINRSSFTLKDAYFGVWTDADLGDAFDDFVGCDVGRGLGYLYNGELIDEDGDSPGYGKFPPAVGIDFFEGPYIDASGKDELKTMKDENGNLICGVGVADFNGDGEPDTLVNEGNIAFNGNLNGLNFGDGVADNERWGMRRYIYHNNGSGAYDDPQTAPDYYRYLTGYWTNGERMSYGGTGHDGTGPDADFMFPGDTDPCNWGTGGVQPPGYGQETGKYWSEIDEGNEPYDRRFIQSAGPFTLEPGNVNDITTGVVWARAYEEDLMASVYAVQKADDKAQALFEECFQMIDGPDAPDLTIIPMSNKFIFHISNEPISNNYLEQYEQEDYFISEEYEDRMFRFQGYQVYQLRDKNVTLSQLQDPNYAQIVFQCDVKDNVEDLVNFEYDSDIEGTVGTKMVTASNSGIVHTFELTTDGFGSGSSRELVNNKKYYYVAVSYAHNEYKEYSQVDGDLLDGQAQPYLASRKSVNGEIPTYEVIPHPRNMDNGGTDLNSDYGTQPAVTQVEGQGFAQKYLKFEEGVEERILAGEKLTELPYQADYSPLNVKIVDPFNISAGEYYVGICADSVHPEHSFTQVFPVFGQFNSNSWGYINDSKWFLAQVTENGTFDTLAISDTWMSEKNEILFDTLGISIDVEQYQFPLGQNLGDWYWNNNLVNNGYLGSALEFENPEEPWLSFVPDGEGATVVNWIRAGLNTEGGVWADFSGNGEQDEEGAFESVLGGTWAPVRLTSTTTFGPNPGGPLDANTKGTIIPSVDIVITPGNPDLWTRVPVLEMTAQDQGSTYNPMTEGGALKFDLRAGYSLDKEGNASSTSVGSSDENDPNYLGGTGWSWFPGYAIDVNTGRRLNMAFGESSALVGFNGRDMLWNPVEAVVSEDGNVIFGGLHYLYVFASDQQLGGEIMYPYDSLQHFANFIHTDRNAALKYLQWVSIPTIRRGYEYVDYDGMPDNYLRIELRVAQPFNVARGYDTVENPINKNYPLYKFDLTDYVPEVNQKQVAEDALESVNVVPNPYYGGNAYELSPLEYNVKIINLPERCSIKIYNMAGTLVRSYQKDNLETIIEWDLKNNYRVPIAGGLYIIHIDAPGVGEKTLKWFGVLRPDDLSSF
ncbi:MAG: T9SS type A sorting domain-containing protein [Salinivirgaceae bacterium]|jgi:hypothetical protein|nr:T9SS type A sorting domain-containing protein [Salinivirgaceae bacterium]